jgi:glutaredoxin
MEALLPRFQAAHTQVLGVSVDSVYSHASWGASLGGVSFPLLADFHPKGGLAKSLGLYLEADGIGDRATVIINSAGVVEFVEAVGPSGQRNIEDLAAKCEEIDKKGAATADFADPKGTGAGTLYVRSNCGPSRFSSWALSNLHLEQIEIKNVSESSSAAAELEKASGGSQAPCLVLGGEATLEHDAIIAKLVAGALPS